MKQIWVGIKGILGKKAGEADSGMTTVKLFVVRGGRGKHYQYYGSALPQARNAHN